VLSSPRYKRFIAALLHWIEAGPWVAGQAAAARKRRMQPLAEFGAVRLAGWRKQLGGEADKLSTEKQRHRVRIETKRYRYMSEALKTLGVPESDKQARARKAAERVQSILGDLRDVRRFRRKYAQRSPDHHAHRRNEKLLQEAAKLLRQLAR
jgi:CHAD domain-containing protein